MAGMTVLLLLLWAGVTVSSPVDLQKRLTRGKTCKDDERKYHVYVKGCGGSRIHKDWVLTAAHCEESTMTAFLGVHPGDLEDNKRNKKGVGINKPYQIYKNSSGSHDLMLLKLKTPFSTATINLPTVDECQKLHKIKEGGDTEVQLAGYGGIAKPSTLQCGNFMILPDDKCTKIKTEEVKKCKDPVVKSKIYQDFFCYSSNTVSRAQGDSGGGVVYDKKLYGVHVAGGGACVSLGIAMNLCNEEYRKWITEHTGLPF